MTRRLTICFLLTLLLPSMLGCQSQNKTSLRVLFAGSLIVPFDDLETAFEKAHPNIDVLMEGHGSIQVIRHVTELDHLVDVIVTADHTLIPALMYQTIDPESDQPYADWYIEFATNRLTLAYTDASLYADEINADNWHNIVARPGVRIGLPDPRFDAAGYRGLMALQLAEMHYDDPTVFEDVIMGRFRNAINAKQESQLVSIHVPEVVEPKRDSGIIMRGGSIQLVALLESGDLDYAFEYESVSQQHGFRYVPLPAAVNLGVEAQAERYAQVRVVLDFQRFASVTPEFQGEFIGYGVSIPTNAPSPKQAAEFIEFLLGTEGQAVMQANHHPLIQPPRAEGYERLPERLRELCVPTP